MATIVGRIAELQRRELVEIGIFAGRYVAWAGQSMSIGERRLV
jgi:hypothetical protein